MDCCCVVGASMLLESVLELFDVSSPEMYWMPGFFNDGCCWWSEGCFSTLSIIAIE